MDEKTIPLFQGFTVMEMAFGREISFFDNPVIIDIR